jgi:hypothetical protein
MHPVALAVLRRYVEPLVKQALKANALAAVSCFTDVSVLFLGISEVDLGAMHPTGGDLWGQLIMATTQECVYDQEGAVRIQTTYYGFRFVGRRHTHLLSSIFSKGEQVRDG